MVMLRSGLCALRGRCDVDSIQIDERRKRHRPADIDVIDIGAKDGLGKNTLSLQVPAGAAKDGRLAERRYSFLRADPAPAFRPRRHRFAPHRRQPTTEVRPGQRQHRRHSAVSNALKDRPAPAISALACDLPLERHHNNLII